MDAIITLTGNLGADPRIRAVGPEQHLFTEFSIANTPRIQRDGVWQDGVTTWYRITCWRRLAENAFSSLRRGDAVIVHGRIRTHEWADKEGVVQTREEVEALSIGPDLNRGTVLVLRRSRAGTPAQAAAPTTGADELATEPQADDEPFATPAGTAVEEVAGPLLGGAAVDHHSLSDDDRPLEDAANDDGRAYGQAVA